MYLENIDILNLRVFAGASASFQHPKCIHAAGNRKPEYPNLNLILGNNGAGKSTLLKAVALACLGPLAEKFSPYLLVRRTGKAGKRRKPSTVDASIFPDDRAIVRARFQCTWQDLGGKKPSDALAELPWSFNINRTGDEESIEPLYSTASSPSPSTPPPLACFAIGAPALPSGSSV